MESFGIKVDAVREKVEFDCVESRGDFVQYIDEVCK